MSTPVSGTRTPAGPPSGAPGSSLTVRLLGAWAFVGIPLAYGVVQTVRKAVPLFGG